MVVASEYQLHISYVRDVTLISQYVFLVEAGKFDSEYIKHCARDFDAHRSQAALGRTEL